MIFAENFFFCCENSGVKRGETPTRGPKAKKALADLFSATDIQMLRLGLAGAARRAGVARAACAGGVGLPARRGMASVPYDKVVCERKTTDDSIKKFFRLTIESTIVATIMAFWWRSSHNAEKEKINRYYATLRAEMAAARAKEEAEDDE